jgi:hypothetical protein
MTTAKGTHMAPQQSVEQTVRSTGDITAYGAFIGWLVGILPSIATLVTAMWFTILIIEKITGKPFHQMVRCAWNKLRGKAA